MKKRIGKENPLNAVVKSIGQGDSAVRIVIHVYKSATHEKRVLKDLQIECYK